MPFVENLSVFLADFGVACSSGGTSFNGIFDLPDETLSHAGVNVLSTGYLLTVRTSDARAAGLASGAAIQVNGQPYVVRDVISLDDGAFSHLTLSK